MQSQIQELQRLVSGGKASDPRALQLLTSLKTQIYTQPALLVGKPSPSELAIARSVAQLNVLHSLATQNVAEFENAMPRLRLFYEKSSTRSPRQNMFEALCLLESLSHNKLSQFYFQLQKLPAQLLEDRYIKYVIDLEVNLTSGRFGSIFKHTESPLIYSKLFMDRIASFSRLQIFKSLQASCQKIALSTCANLHHFASDREMVAFAEQLSLKGEETAWEIKGGFIEFKRKENEQAKVDAESNLEMAIKFAKQLQKIV